MSYGITENGFVKKTFAEIAAETTAELRAALGSNIQLDDVDPLGQIKGVLDERESLLWELGEATYNAVANIDSAEGVALDNAVAFNGISRLAATNGTAVITITGTPATVIPAGFQVQRSDDESVIFELDAETTIPGGGSIDADFTCSEAGFFTAVSGTLTVIVSPLAGVTSVTNADDAIPGRDLETDIELRARRLRTLESANFSSDPGIRSALEDEVDGVTAAFVVSNRGAGTDSDGRPGHSFEAYVLGGTDEDIAAKIGAIQPAGVQSWGTESVEVTLSTGDVVTVRFSRITIQELEAEITITPNTDISEGPLYAGDAFVKTALKEYFDTLGAGNDVINSATYTPINTVAGVIGIEAKYRLKGVGSYVTTNIAIPRDRIPRLAEDDITVIS